MSESLDLALDLEKAFLPSWAQNSGDTANANKYAKYDGSEGAERGEGRGFRGNRPPRPGGPGRGGGGFGSGGGFGPRPDRGPRRDFGPRPGGRGPGGPGGPGGGGLRWDPTQAGEGGRPGRPRDGRRPDRREAPEPLIPVDIDLRPDPAGVSSLARQIKLGGRAYPLLEVAGLVVQKPDRYEVTFRVLKGKDGQPQQRLFVCSLDDSIWLSEADAVRHALKAHFDTFYQTQTQPCDPPKGVWTLVAMFDEIVLGPPNYHGYQERLREIHAQRAPRLPFEVFKSKVRIVKDEAAVKQWVDGQSQRLEYTTLNVPEAQTLHSVGEVEMHFRSVHATNLVKEVSHWTLNRAPNAPRLPEPLLRLLRVTMDRERRFPIRTMTSLSGAFAQAGLQFFKRDKTVVHVAVARPHFLDLDATAVQPGLRQIIEYINANAGTTRKQLVEAIAPSPAPEAAPAPATPAPEASSTPAEGAAPAPAPAPAPAAPAPTAAQQELLGNLHWLIHQGHVIEFANGLLETAKKPTPKPEPAAPKAQEPKGDRPKKDRPPRPRGRYVFDNAGLLPIPAAQPALVG